MGWSERVGMLLRFRLTGSCACPVDDKGKTGKKRATLYMVTPYMDHDLSGMLTNPDIRFSEAQIKCYMQQLLEGLRYLHDVCQPHNLLQWWI